MNVRLGCATRTQRALSRSSLSVTTLDDADDSELLVLAAAVSIYTIRPPDRLHSLVTLSNSFMNNTWTSDVAKNVQVASESLAAANVTPGDHEQLHVQVRQPSAVTNDSEVNIR